MRVNPENKKRIQLLLGLGILALAVLISFFSVGESQQVAAAKNDIFLTLDVSGSMDRAGKLEAAKNAAIEFVNVLGLENSTDNRVGLISFNNETRVITPLSSDPVELRSAILALSAGGGTAIGDAISLAGEELAQNSRSDAGRIVVLMTDGRSNSGKSPTVASIEVANEGVKIFSVSYGVNASTTTLRRVASTTGGEYFRVITGTELVGAFGTIARTLVEPVAHFGSRTLILIAIRLLLFIPEIEKGMSTVARKAGETLLGRSTVARPSSQVTVPQGIICPECKKINRPTSKFCNQCRTPLIAAPSIQKCKECGHQNRLNVRFCSRCGHELGAELR